jgi:stage II sporulation protein GA (sporulation sigma-E factor processing peptidase)
MNFYILWITSKLTKKNSSNLKLIIGSVIGALYVIVLLFPNMSILTSHFSKLLLSVIIITITFKPKEILELARLVSYFYIISFMVGGAAFALFYLTDTGSVLSNGIFLWKNTSIPMWTLVVAPIFVYTIIRISWEYIQNKFMKETLCLPLRITSKDLTADLTALVDTGNSLFEPISRLPVIVVEFQMIKNILPTQLCDLFNKNLEGDLDTLSKLNPSFNLRVIPYTTIGNPCGIILGFKPEEIKILRGEGNYQMINAIIGIFNGKLSRDSSYGALLNPEIIQN